MDLSIATLIKLYKDGALSPRSLVKTLHTAMEKWRDHNIWIHRLSLDELEPYLLKLEASQPDDLPLYGVPFAIKDNIDLARIPTTAGCEAYRYTPEKSAFVVEQLIQAGAIPLGKTNLDQFATGLVGTRSPEPWGPCKNAFDPAFISGGSSAGSAVAVAAGLVTFSLGTDTAGSGRVPASLNNLIGIKPSRGLLSMTGVVPACRSLDCVSIFTLNTDDGNELLTVAGTFDDTDAYARKNTRHNSHRSYGQDKSNAIIGVLPADQLEFFGDSQTKALYESFLGQLKSLGHNLVEVDFKPFNDAAKLLYGGPWVAERFVAIEELITQQPETLLDVTRKIIGDSQSLSAATVFKSMYQLKSLKREADAVLNQVDLMITPTIGRPYTIEAVNAEPIKLNTELGHYTNFMNLLDYAALSIPIGFLESGLPYGITAFHQAFSDRDLLSWGRTVMSSLKLTTAKNPKAHVGPDLSPEKTTKTVDLVVCGAHLDGYKLNWQLLARGGKKLESTSTSPNYRMFLLPGEPKRPGLIRDTANGREIEVEVWQLDVDTFGSFVEEVGRPLGIGKLELSDGRWRTGFICEGYIIPECQEITEHGSWRTFLSA
jgi:allophanate hydrolase